MRLVSAAKADGRSMLSQHAVDGVGMHRPPCFLALAIMT